MPDYGGGTASGPFGKGVSTNSPQYRLYENAESAWEAKEYARTAEILRRLLDIGGPGQKRDYLLFWLGNALEKLKEPVQALQTYKQCAELKSDMPGPYMRMAILGERHKDYLAALRGAVWLVYDAHDCGQRDKRELRRIARIQEKCPAPSTDRTWRVRRAADDKVYGPYNRVAIAQYTAEKLLEITDEAFDDKGNRLPVIQLIALPAQLPKD